MKRVHMPIYAVALAVFVVAGVPTHDVFMMGGMHGDQRDGHGGGHNPAHRVAGKDDGSRPAAPDGSYR